MSEQLNTKIARLKDEIKFLQLRLAVALATVEELKNKEVLREKQEALNTIRDLI